MLVNELKDLYSCDVSSSINLRLTLHPNDLRIKMILALLKREGFSYRKRNKDIVKCEIEDYNLLGWNRIIDYTKNTNPILHTILQIIPKNRHTIKYKNIQKRKFKENKND